MRKDAASAEAEGTETAVGRSVVMLQRHALRILIAAVYLGPAGFALAQTQPPPNEASDASRHSTGQTPPEEKGQKQPQGWTGPIETTTGGAPAESPQGQSPPGMQAAPQGSDKTVTAPDKKN
jgi:hypothetical protein